MFKYTVRLNTQWDCDAVIDRVEVERETAKSVWIRGRKNAKSSEYASYYDSWDDARNALLVQQRLRIDSLRRQLELANGRMANIKGMRDNKPGPGLERDFDTDHRP